MTKQHTVKSKAAECFMLSDLLQTSLKDLVDEAGEGCKTHEEAFERLLAYLGAAQMGGLEASLGKLGAMFGRPVECL